MVQIAMTENKKMTPRVLQKRNHYCRIIL